MGKTVAGAIGWFAVLVLALALRLVTSTHIDPADPAAQPFDGDCQYHRFRAEQIAADYPHVGWSDPDLGDGGTEIPWPPLFDEVIAGAARVAALGTPSPEGLARAAAWVPVVLGAVTVLLVGVLAASLAGPELALGAASLLALSGPHALYSEFGRSDQHVMELLLTVALLISYAKALSAKTRASWWAATVTTGVCITLAFWNWQGSALDLLFLAAFISSWHVIVPREERRAPSPAAALATGCGIGAVMLAGSVAALAPDGALARTTISGVSGLHVLLTAASGIHSAALWGLRRLRPSATSPRRAVEVITTALAMLGAAALAPSFRDGVSHGLLALLNGNHWYASISEFQPMLLSGNQPLSQELLAVLAQYGLAPLLAVLGLAELRRRWAQGPEAERPAILLLAVWSVLSFALAIARNRFALYAAPPLAILAWMGIRHAQVRLVPGLSRGALGRAFVATAVATAVAGPLIQYIRHARGPAGVTAGPLLAWTKGRPDPTGAPAIYARWGWGHHVRALARRPAVANPFGTEGGARGFEESLRVFLSTDEGEVERVLRERRAGYLLSEDPRADVLSYQDVLRPEAHVAKVASSWRTGRTMVENGRYRALVAYRLHFHDGSAADGQPALGGFRLLREMVAADPKKSVVPAFALFGFVPGARLAVTGAVPGAEVEATTVVRTNTGREFRWRTTGHADASGATVLRVPYTTGENGSCVAGPFEVADGRGKRVTTVVEEAVVAGRSVSVQLNAAEGSSPITGLARDGGSG